MRVGLTGGIATGKSTVSRMLRQRGAAIVDADQAARAVVMPGSEGIRKVREAFGDQVIAADGNLDRAALRNIVFQDEAARKKLNGILHPLIIEHMEEEVARYQQAEEERPVVLDVPLLIEENLTGLAELVVVVYLPEDLQLKRLMERDGISAAEARRMVGAQMPIEEKKPFADVLIDNTGSLADTERQVDALWRILVSKNGSDRL